MSEITKPADVIINSMTIDDIDVTALLVNVEIFENIFMSVITGSITLMDSDGGQFIEDNKIEFNEPFKFSITGAGETNELMFEGVLNGLRGEGTRNETRTYTIDFTTMECRKNEETFVTKRFKYEKPEDIITYVLEDKLEAQELNIEQIKGQPMHFVGSRRKPLWVIKYVLTHGVVTPEASDGQSDKKEEKENKGTSGFLLWQSLSESGTGEFRGSTLDQILEGSFDNHEGYKNNISNSGNSMEEMMTSILHYDFQTLGDIQSKMKSGAFKSTVISFDMDTGLYKEIPHSAEEQMTEKQKEIVTKPTRFLVRNFTNDKWSQECEKHPPNDGDQSRDYLAQNNSRQNTFNDQSGKLIMYPQFNMRAGDTIDISIGKYDSGSGDNMPHEKHSGKYVIKQMVHMIEVGSKSYSQATVLRATETEQNQ